MSFFSLQLQLVGVPAERLPFFFPMVCLQALVGFKLVTLQCALCSSLNLPLRSSNLVIFFTTSLFPADFFPRLKCGFPVVLLDAVPFPPSFSEVDFIFFTFSHLRHFPCFHLTKPLSALRPFVFIPGPKRPSPLVERRFEPLSLNSHPPFFHSPHRQRVLRRLIPRFFFFFFRPPFPHLHLFSRKSSHPQLFFLFPLDPGRISGVSVRSLFPFKHSSPLVGFFFV